MPHWLILALWGSASVFVTWLALVSETQKRRAARREDQARAQLTEEERLLAEAFPTG